MPQAAKTTRMQLPLSKEVIMSVSMRVLGAVAAGMLALSAAAGHAGGGGDGMTANPRYEFWANFKPGANSTYHETTKLSGPAKAFAPDGIEKKTITYRLLNVDKDKAVVLTTVV